MRRKIKIVMKLIVIAALSIFFATSLYNWSTGRIRLMKTWSIGSGLIAISPDGKFLATPYVPYQKAKIGIEPIKAEAKVKLYTFPDEELICTLKAFPVTQLAFSPDSSLITAGTGLGEILIWRTEDGQLLHSLKASIIKPGKESVGSVIFSRDGQTLVSRVGGHVDVWRVVDGQLLYSLSNENNPSRATMSPDGQILALGGARTPITLYRFSDGTRIRQLEVNGDPKFSPDGKLLAISRSTSYRDSWQKVLLYRLEDNTLLGELIASSVNPLDSLLGLSESLIDVAFSQDGHYLAATYTIHGTGPGIFPGPDLSPPGRWHLALWRLDNLSLKHFIPKTIQSQKKSLTALAFSPDGKILVSGGNSIRLWRVPD